MAVSRICRLDLTSAGSRERVLVANMVDGAGRMTRRPLPFDAANAMADGSVCQTAPGSVTDAND
ncbi:MAG: hypothetical protein QNJ07_16975 [Woeseiaceae bacterium]|nr:hypothetical protein [Woeseiaceae bacterium]